MARLLVVDDDVRVRSIIVDLLRLEGHAVETAANGRDAIDRLAQRSFDLIVSDLKMPHLDGVGLYDEVRARWPHMLRRMLFITGSAMAPQYANFISRERPALLVKPLGIAELRDRVQATLAAASAP